MTVQTAQKPDAETASRGRVIDVQFDGVVPWLHDLLLCRQCGADEFYRPRSWRTKNKRRK